MDKKYKLASYIVQRKPIDYIKAKLQVSSHDLLHMLHSIKDDFDFYLPTLNKNGSKLEYEPYRHSCHFLEWKNPNHLKIVLKSDDHIGHINDRLGYNYDIYNEALKGGYDYVIDLGDLLHGPASKTNKPKVNCREKTLEEQLNRLIRFHPDPKELPTYFITGNHDLKFMETDFCDIGRLIESELSNFHFLDNLFAMLDFNGFRINISHGSLESRERIIDKQVILEPQRLVDIDLKNEFPFLSERNPDIIAQGHFHWGMVPEYIPGEPLKMQVPASKFCGSETSYDKENECSMGAIFLDIHKYDNNYYIEYELQRVIEHYDNVKNEFILKR